MKKINDSTSIKLTRNNEKSRFETKSSASIRKERAKEALMCLKLSGHEASRGSALDLGCGPGYVTGHFSEKGIRTVGLDLGEGVLSNAKLENPSADFVLASGVNIPFRWNAFHTIILNDVLEHVSYGDGEIMLRQIRGVLSPEGKLYISVANKYQIREPHTLLFFITWLPRKLYDPVIRRLHNMEPIYPYTVKRLRNLCKEIGFINENYTWVYASRKILNLNYVRDVITKKLINFLRNIKLSSNTLFTLAEKFCVILFVCER